METQNTIPTWILETAARNPDRKFAVDSTGNVIGVEANELMSIDARWVTSLNAGYMPLFRRERPDYWIPFDLEKPYAPITKWNVIPAGVN